MGEVLLLGGRGRGQEKGGSSKIKISADKELKANRSLLVFIHKLVKINA